MENNYKNKNIAIVGFGKTGESCTRFFLNKNVSSIKVTDALEKNIPSDLRNTICTFDFSSLNSKWILDSDLIVLSPGISLDLEVISKAKIKGIEIVNDIELFARENKTPLIGITGSNGKTTTVSLL
ncbi:MAG: UDP-N-acetylmuramoyl-L-alanine--D-glutamate ligase, partial [Psittacicella sp.]